MNIIEIPRSLRPARYQTDARVTASRSDSRVVLVTGATGFIGRHVCRRVLAAGDRLIVLTRNRGRANDLYGPNVRICTSLDEIGNECRIDAIVNLAGEPIFRRPWTRQRRAQLIESRLTITQALIDLIARLEHKPDALVSGSAVGYYGVRGDEELSEIDRGQTIFQSQLCQLWEMTAQKARIHGVRVCMLRLGVVLGNEGGALPQQKLAARFGLTTVLGTGQQWVSWIHVDDAVRLIDHCLVTEALQGPVNAVAPFPVRQAQFAAALSRSLAFRPLRVPASLLRSVLGERAQLLVDGQRVLPMKAGCSGFRFHFAELPSALADLESVVAPFAWRWNLRRRNAGKCEVNQAGGLSGGRTA